MKSSLAIWLDAARPKTLLLAIAAIATGSSLAYADHHFSLAISLLALLTATLLQILSNLANDYGDAVQGTDNENRIGPIRGMQQGMITQAGMKKAITLNIVFIVISGLALVFYALQSPTSIMAFIFLGLLSIISSIAYTMGSKPYGYIGLGDISVFIFFGLLAILGTYFLHTGTVKTDLLLPAIGSGLFSMGVLNINNMRDVENDTVSNKRTLVVRIGIEKAKCYHLGLLAFGWLTMAIYLVMHTQPIWLNVFMLLPLLLIFKHGKTIWNIQQAKQFVPMLPDMVKCAFITNIVFSIVMVLGQ
ncbi:1,4-dihydroxy-2-naphthoate polyprenyltransferase [Vibrio algivorus]|uniref:1,4-dihydroxy-2-naphthoate octaprenyltransferase n=1 Tax=Vibrio algivorus TaxID=1667024 RepID=A0A557PBC9_9VIBR|nr:1,4-dihydroxy-2-naphthoate polyprenyltransferase [Vibrio algivorus]TVO37948.1 1,4-dihydroxy-2-naphthoate polyprenyltransferase [Vibrio algivorus]GLT14727.1 1,4-dihydroxy-2-naphthoate octaprenyltransferase [Vibrio algivorus]